MLFFGANSLNELKESVINAVKQALNSFKDEEADVIKLTATINDLKQKAKVATENLEELKLTKKIELRDIEHLVKIKEEKNAIELEKKTIELQKQFNDKEMLLLKENQAKVLEIIETTKKEFKELYTEILNRLPNINATIDLNQKK